MFHQSIFCYTEDLFPADVQTLLYFASNGNNYFQCSEQTIDSIELFDEDLFWTCGVVPVRTLIIAVPITQANAKQCAELSHEARRRSPVRMLMEMQDRLMQDVLNDEIEPRERAQCACAWDKLEARKAVLQGMPANTSQSIKSEPSSRKSVNSSHGPLEPIPEEKPEQ